MTCYYNLHYRRNEPVCPACRAQHAAYARQWRRKGPRSRWGLAERIVDVVATHEPVAVTEITALLPNVKAESVRRTVYRLIGAGRLRRFPANTLTIGTP